MERRWVQRQLAGVAAMVLVIGSAPAVVGSGPRRDQEPTGQSVAVEEGALAVVSATSGWIDRRVPTVVTAGGAELGRTVDSDRTYLHAVVANEEDACGTSADVQDGSVYLRTGSDGRNWGQRRRICGIDARVVAAGRHVYVAVEARRCGYGVGILRNNDHGRRAAWSSLGCLSRTPNDMGRPGLGATGRFVYVGSANGRTGRVGVHISRDHGRNWNWVGLGWAYDDGEPGGDVAVAATGRSVAVAWTTRGVTRVRVSRDTGRHWARAVRLPAGLTSASGRGARLALSGYDDAHRTAWVRVWSTGSGWHGSVSPPGADGRPLVALRGTSSLAVVSCARDATTDTWSPTWVTSPDDGLVWGTPELIPGTCAEAFVWGPGGHAWVLHYDEEWGDGYALGTRMP